MTEAPVEPDDAPLRHRTRALVVLVVVAVGVIVIDQLSKAWAVAELAPRIAAGEPPVPILGGLLTLTFFENPGASFGIGSGFTWIFTAIALGVAVVIVRVSRRLASIPWAVALGALLGGALGNLMDRLFRSQAFGMGHVVDFIGFGNWFVNNVADIAITLAAVLMVLLAMLGIEVTGERTTSDTPDAEPA